MEPNRGEELLQLQAQLPAAMRGELNLRVFSPKFIENLTGDDVPKRIRCAEILANVTLPSSLWLRYNRRFNVFQSLVDLASMNPEVPGPVVLPASHALWAIASNNDLAVLQALHRVDASSIFLRVLIEANILGLCPDDCPEVVMAANGLLAFVSAGIEVELPDVTSFISSVTDHEALAALLDLCIEAHLDITEHAELVGSFAEQAEAMPTVALRAARLLEDPVTIVSVSETVLGQIPTAFSDASEAEDSQMMVSVAEAGLLSMELLVDLIKSDNSFAEHLPVRTMTDLFTLSPPPELPSRQMVECLCDELLVAACELLALVDPVEEIASAVVAGLQSLSLIKGPRAIALLELQGVLSEQEFAFPLPDVCFEKLSIRDEHVIAMLFMVAGLSPLEGKEALLKTSRSVIGISRSITLHVLFALINRFGDDEDQEYWPILHKLFTAKRSAIEAALTDIPEDTPEDIVEFVQDNFEGFFSFLTE